MNIISIRLPSGKEPIQEFLEELEDPKMIKKIIRNLELLEKYGFRLLKADKDYKKLAGYGKYNLWELRFLQNTNICRIVFCLRSQNAYLLHAFEKKSQKTPTREIATAISRIKFIQQ